MWSKPGSGPAAQQSTLFPPDSAHHADALNNQLPQQHCHVMGTDVLVLRLPAAAWSVCPWQSGGRDANVQQHWSSWRVCRWGLY
jgi:hypothetical protein